jgi:hypothetical protein
MVTFKKKELNELVGGDIGSDGGDRNVTSDTEIETGPVQKPYNDDSDYEKGVSTTTDKVFGRYRQNIPWFAVYSFGGTRTGGVKAFENTEITKKKNVEEKIEDLVKKTKPFDVTEKGYNPNISKIIGVLKNADFTDKELEDLSRIISGKKNNSNKKL